MSAEQRTLAVDAAALTRSRLCASRQPTSRRSSWVSHRHDRAPRRRADSGAVDVATGGRGRRKPRRKASGRGDLRGLRPPDGTAGTNETGVGSNAGLATRCAPCYDRADRASDSEHIEPLIRAGAAGRRRGAEEALCGASGCRRRIHRPVFAWVARGGVEPPTGKVARRCTGFRPVPSSSVPGRRSAAVARKSLRPDEATPALLG